LKPYLNNHQGFVVRHNFTAHPVTQVVPLLFTIYVNQYHQLLHIYYHGSNFRNLPNTPSGSLLPAVACRYSSPVSRFLTSGNATLIRFSTITEENPSE